MTTMESVFRVCVDCGEHFEITPSDQQLLEERAAADGANWNLPRRCSRCRLERRRLRLQFDNDHQDEWFTCVDCGAVFVFGGKDKAFFSRSGFAKPKRCRPCRERRRAGVNG